MFVAHNHFIFHWFLYTKTKIDGEKYVDFFDKGIFNGVGYFQLIALGLMRKKGTTLEFSYLARAIYLMPLLLAVVLKQGKNFFCKCTNHSTLVKATDLVVPGVFWNPKTWPARVFNKVQFVAVATVVMGFLCENFVYQPIAKALA